MIPGPRSPSRFALATLLVTSLAACTRSEAPSPGARDSLDPGRSGPTIAAVTRAPATADDSARVDDAEAAMRAWLDAAREPGPDDTTTTRALDPQQTLCDDGHSYFPSPLLARYELTASELRGDTVVARASVTTVAEQDVDRRARDRFVARQRVRTDVLEWDVIPVDGGWAVCNGIRFGYRGSDSLTGWVPEGASLHSARVAADSLRRMYDGVRIPTSGAHAGPRANARADTRASAMTGAPR